MTDFIHHMIQRQVETDRKVQPRVRGRFEPGITLPEISAQDSLADREEERDSTPVFTGGVFNRQMAAQPERITDITGKPYAGESREPGAGAPVTTSRLTFNSRSDFAHAVNPAPKSPNSGPELIPGNSLRNPIQPPATHYTPHRQEYIVKPAVKTGPGSGNIEFKSIRTGSAGIMGQPPGLGEAKTATAPDPLRQFPQAETAPVIKVTIGRIEVRAVSAPVPPTAPAKAPPRPVMSLDDYLQRRKGRK
jgi:hypothetical protein